MAGHRSFSELTKRHSPASKARVATKVTELRAMMALAELRDALDCTQADVSKLMKVKQPAVAKLEKRSDMHVSNVRRYVEALGGKLEITATIKGRKIEITNFLTQDPPRERAQKRTEKRRVAG